MGWQPPGLSRKRPRSIPIDRTNHNVFQPLLYQVATSELAPSQIGSPIREIFRNQKNTTVILGEVTGVDKEQKRVVASNADRDLERRCNYDYLILWPPALPHSYFGHNEFAEVCPGAEEPGRCRGRPKQGLAGVRTSRGRGRSAPVTAIWPDLRFLVGAGPTGRRDGFECWRGAQSARTLRSEFRRVDPATARIVLVDHAVRGSLPRFPSSSLRAAKRRSGEPGRRGPARPQRRSD